MITRKTIISLILLTLTSLIYAQVPFAFRYQAAVRNSLNRPINDEVTFDIKLFSDANASNEIYNETHIIKPDTNGLVAFSIGEGETSDNFNSIVWANGPYYIQVLLNNEEISYSQLISVPYAMHANTAGALHNLQSPSLDSDPATKKYVDSLARAPQDLVASASGDTLLIGSATMIVPGLSSQNLPTYNNQLVLGGSYNETLIEAQKTDDGGLILLGQTQSGNGDVSNFKGDADIWVVKLNASLGITWSKTLGGSSYDNPVMLIQEDDGYLIGATTESDDGDISSNSGEFDIWLCKLDADGEIDWEASYGGGGTEFLNSIVPNGNDEYIIGATTFSNGGDINWLNGECDIWIFKINSNHEISSTVTLGGSEYDALVSLELNQDNTISITGNSSSNDGDFTGSNGALDFLSATLDNNLNILSYSLLGSTNNEQLFAQNDNILGGVTYAQNWSIATGNKLKNIYITNNSDNAWTQQLGGSDADLLIDLDVSNDTVTILGQTASFDNDITDSKGGEDIWFLRLLPNGNVSTNKIFGGTYDETPQLIIPLDEGWLIAGESESSNGDVSRNFGAKDIWLVKLDANANIVWEDNFGGSYNEYITDIIINSSNEFIICGTTLSNDYGITGLHNKAGKASDIWILKVNTQE